MENKHRHSDMTAREAMSLGAAHPLTYRDKRRVQKNEIGSGRGHQPLKNTIMCRITYGHISPKTA